VENVFLFGVDRPIRQGDAIHDEFGFVETLSLTNSEDNSGKYWILKLNAGNTNFKVHCREYLFTEHAAKVPERWFEENVKSENPDLDAD
jgi:hypothetical protein